MARNQKGSRGKTDRPGTPQHPISRTSGGPKKYVGPQAARENRRRRNQKWLGFGSIAIVIVIVAGFILAKVTGVGSSPSSVSPAAGTPVAAALTRKLTSVSLSTLAAAPTVGLQASPQSIADPRLTAAGKPELLFVGAEFCPICATERWAMYVALSKFGTFSPPPGRIHSSVTDGDIQTVTFYKTTFTSPYFTFTPVETTTNQPSGNYYVTLQTPTAAQMKLWQAHTSQSFPWLDFAGKSELTSAQLNPALLEGMSFDQIASAVGNNSTAIGSNVDAAAKVLIQTICSTLTNSRPANVCLAVGRG